MEDEEGKEEEVEFTLLQFQINLSRIHSVRSTGIATLLPL